MNDEEIRLIKGYFNDGYCCDLDELKNIANKMIKENNKLQFNWNSLRENLKRYDLTYLHETGEHQLADAIEDILDKMNELEGVENDTTIK